MQNLNEKGLKSLTDLETRELSLQKSQAELIAKGEQLGHFAYGGSTELLIFEAGKINSLSVEQAQRIGKFKRTWFIAYARSKRCI